jgi:hypothetical protein
LIGVKSDYHGEVLHELHIVIGGVSAGNALARSSVEAAILRPFS